ncbi:MAG: hypothetical protein ACPGTU_11690 [Myxococcota bacterium]
MKAWWLVGLVLCAVVSGCSSKGAESDADGDDGGSDADIKTALEDRRLFFEDEELDHYSADGVSISSHYYYSVEMHLCSTGDFRFAESTSSWTSTSDGDVSVSDDIEDPEHCTWDDEDWSVDCLYTGEWSIESEALVLTVDGRESAFPITALGENSVAIAGDSLDLEASSYCAE